MDDNIGKMFIEIRASNLKLQADVKKIESQLESEFKKTGEKSGSSFGAGLKKMLGGLSVIYAMKKALDIGMQAKNIARDAEETRSKFDTVFSSIKNRANDMAESFATSFGLAGTTARELLGNTGDLLVGFGFTERKALDLSTQVNKLAQDLSSFTNYSGGAIGASQALTKGLLGETEAMKSLGISVKQDTKQFQTRMVQIQATTGATELQSKAIATLEEAYKQSNKAIGDYGRTKDSLANVEKRLDEQLKTQMETIGNGLTPAFIGLNKAMSGWLTLFQRFMSAGAEESPLNIAVLDEYAESLKKLSWKELQAEEKGAFNQLQESFAKLDKINAKIYYYEETKRGMLFNYEKVDLKAKLKELEIEKSYNKILNERYQIVSDIQATGKSNKYGDEDKVIVKEIKTLENLKTSYKNLQTQLSTTEVNTPLFNELVKKSTDAKLEIEKLEKYIKELSTKPIKASSSIVELEEKIASLTEEILKTSPSDTGIIVGLQKQVKELNQQLKDAKTNLIGLQVHTEGLGKKELADLEPKGQVSNKKTTNLREKMSPKELGKSNEDLDNGELTAYNNGLKEQDGLWANIQDAQSQAMGNLASAWVSQIKLFEQANSMLQQFLNTLVQIALQQVALQLIGTFASGGTGAGAKAGSGILGFIGGLFGAEDGGTFTSKGKIASFSGGVNNFKVPDTGYQKDSYPILVKPGEVVNVTPTGQVGQTERLLAQVNSSIMAMNMTLIRKDMSPKVSFAVDSVKLVETAIKPTENRLMRQGVELDKL